MAETTITFLGTGTSLGVPVIGCDCAVCKSTDPHDRRTRSSIYVETPECSFVVDTGTDFRAQCLRENLRKLDAVVFTHSHTDHIMGFDDLRPFCMPDKWMPVYASPETMRDLHRVFRFAFQPESRVPGYIHPEEHITAGPFKLGGTELPPLPVTHGRAHVNGYLLRRGGEPLAAYLSDCKVVPDTVIEAIAGVKTLIIDALRHRTHPTHMNIEEALLVAGKVRPAATWLTHICHELPHAETEKNLPPGVKMAYDGLKIGI